MSRRRSGDEVVGILNLVKPAGMSSAAAVAVARRALDARRAGHAGTLDPLATGVLPICFGSATRLVEYAHRWPKRYRGFLRLGLRSATYDAEGPLEAGSDPSGVTRADVEAVLPAFRGRILQRPPAYSALHQGGERLYALARKGEAVEAPEREVEVHELVAVEFWPGAEARLELEIECATGTYVRSLAHDIGQALGTGAYLESLVRTAYGPLRIEDGTGVEDLARLDPVSARATLLPADRLVVDLPAVALGQEQRTRLLNGNPVAVEDRILPGAAVRAYWQGELLAIARMSPTRMLEPVKVFPEAGR